MYKLTSEQQSGPVTDLLSFQFRGNIVMSLVEIFPISIKTSEQSSEQKQEFYK